MGSVFAARRAGIITEKKVIRVPEMMPWETTVGVTLIPLPGNETPIAATTVTSR